VCVFECVVKLRVWIGLTAKNTQCLHHYVRTTASETEALALPVRKFGTVCHVGCEHDIGYKHFKTTEYICLTRPRRFVTFYISALDILLLTYHCQAVLTVIGTA